MGQAPLPAKPFFANPKFTRAFLANRNHLRGGTDSTQAISEERSREVLTKSRHENSSK